MHALSARGVHAGLLEVANGELAAIDDNRRRWPHTHETGVTSPAVGPPPPGVTAAVLAGGFHMLEMDEQQEHRFRLLLLDQGSRL
jgi:hypothetical protein